MLIRAFGITIQAVSTVVAVFLGGLALGAFLAGRIVSRRKDLPLLRWYAIAELSIAGSALLATWAAGHLPEAWAAIIRAIGLALPVRFALAALVLIVPTTLMGATLPLLTGYLATQRDLV